MLELSILRCSYLNKNCKKIVAERLFYSIKQFYLPFTTLLAHIKASKMVKILHQLCQCHFPENENSQNQIVFSKDKA